MYEYIILLTTICAFSHFLSIICSLAQFPSELLSIGSLGKGGAVADVQNVLFENVVMVDELYGARFKSWTGGNGLARNITWRNIVLYNVPFPIYVTQNYWDQNVSLHSSVRLGHDY